LKPVPDPSNDCTVRYFFTVNDYLTRSWVFFPTRNLVFFGILSVIVGSLLTAVMVWGFPFLHAMSSGAVVALAAVNTLLLSLLMAFRFRVSVRQQIRQHPEAYPLTELCLAATPSGLELSFGDSRSVTPWSIVQSIRVSHKQVFILFGRAGVSVPIRALPGTAEAYVAQLESIRAQSTSPATDDTSPLPEGEESNEFTHTYTLTPQDYILFNRWIVDHQRAGNRRQFRRALWILLPLLAMIFGFGLLDAVFNDRSTLLWALIPLAAVLALTLSTRPLNRYVLIPRAIQRAIRRNQLVVGECKIACDPQGVRSVSNRGDVALHWKQVTGITQTTDAIYILIGNVQGLVMPLRSFDSEESAQTCFTTWKTWMETHHAKPAGTLVSRSDKALLENPYASEQSLSERKSF